MAGTFYRLLIIYLSIGLVLHIGGVQTTQQNNNDFTTNFVSYDPLNISSHDNNYTGLNSNFESSISSVQTDTKIATGVFGFIDTLASVFKFITFLLTGMVFSPLLLFTTYQLPAIFTYLFGSVLMFGLIMGIILLIRSGMSP